MSTFNVPDLLAESSGDSRIETIRDVIDAAANSCAERTFLISPQNGQTLTFAGLRQNSQKLVFDLQKVALAPGDKVAFLMDNGLYTAQLFLGLMYGGFVAVPLNVAAGELQLSYTLDHSDAMAIFVSDQYRALLEAVLSKVPRKIHIITADVDSGSGDIDPDADYIKLPALRPEDPALLMYTSGSTGKPRAAVHSHSTILAHGRNSILSHQLTASDRSLLVLPLYHINAECVTLVPTLMSRGSVVIPNRFNVSQFWDSLEECGCTWSAIVPTIVSQLLDWKDPRAGERKAAFKRIRFLRSSSAPLAPSLHREFVEKFNILLIQAMGCSEGGNVFSNPQPPAPNKIGSPGLPWDFETKIIDRLGNEVPAGEPGEVLLRGPALAKGYYKDPQATMVAFDADGWFHTGDLAYRDEEGYFFVVGRSKELIIKGGVNIAPRQIDDVIESHPAVLEAAAIGVPDHYLGEDVVAFVVLRAGLSCEKSELLRFCEDRLGLFKTPTRIHFVSDLPKGPSGKVQRLRLREDATELLATKAAVPGTEFQKPGENEVAAANADLPVSAIEEVIASVWKQALGQHKIERDSNFFELGGHSLLAVKCVSLLREKIAIPLSLSDFFENATIAHQAALIKRRFEPSPQNGASVESASGAHSETALESISSSATPAAIPPRDRKLPYPLTSAQRRVWFFEQLNPGQPLYNEAEAVRLLGELNVDALERALNIIVERHEVLRSTIDTNENEPVVVVHDSWPVQIKRLDLIEVSAKERHKQVDRLLIDEPREPYHLESRPGIRITVVRLAPNEHVLILMMHHIICDWSSEGVFWRELSAIYSALLRGEAHALPPLPIHHGDYAVWQVQHETEAAFSKDLDFWETMLRGAPQLLDLPADRMRPPVLSYRGKRQRFVLNEELTQALRQVSQRAQTTLFAVFAAAFNTLLYRYTGQPDISLGIPIADRDRTEMQSMMGFLLHTQVLRTQISDDITFRELLSSVQKAALELYLHRGVPFDQVVRRLNPDRNPAYATLFQVMLNWRDRDQLLSFIGLEGLEVESLVADARTAKFDLTLFATDCGNEIWLEAEYGTDLFDDDRIARMFGHYQTLLQSIADGIDIRLVDLPVLTEPEKKQLAEWNDTSAEYPRDKSLQQLFEEQVERTPEEIAVEFEGHRLTYRELNEQANQLSHELRKEGAGPNDLLGVCIERSIEMIIALLAVVKSGAAYVPLAPDLPVARLAYMIEDSGMRILLTQRQLRSSLPAFTGKLIEVDAEEWRFNPRETERVSVTAENLAYVIYTSGSTGKPKGVEVPRGALSNVLWSMKDWLKPERGHSVLALTTISFDIAAMEIWLPLTFGGRMVLMTRETAKNGEELASIMDEHDIRLAQGTPATWRLLLGSGWRGKPDLTAICTGEAMPWDLAQQLQPLVACLWNLYGPTETTIWSSGCVVDKEQKSVLIGRPVANTQCYVLDNSRMLLPIGVVGELYIGGEGLARGYHNLSELTDERFVANPFVCGKRMYRTGDLARYRPDGNIECLGRTDHQVKIRGYRIELGEIESVLRNHPAVREAAVTVREEHGKQLAAYVATANGAACTSSELRTYLKAKLPEYMIPAAWTILENLPLSPNGKLDRKALPSLEATLSSPAAGYVPPEDDFERLICDAWAEVLGLKRVGVRDNFFDLGGHSLLAVQLMLRLQQIIPGEEVPLRAVLEAPTVEQFANWLRTHRSDGRERLVCLKKGSAERPLIFSLHGAWGHVLGLRALAMALPADLSFYCFQDPGLDGSAPFESVEETARSYVDELLRVQAEGPYNLVGQCYGGLVAFEMARILENMGKCVALVVLIDVLSPSFVRSLSKRERFVRNLTFFPRRIGWHLKILWTERPHDMFGYLRWCFRGLWRHLQTLTAPRLNPDDFDLPDVGTRFRATLRRIKEANMRAARKFMPKPYNGDVLIFRSSARKVLVYDDFYLGWRSLVRGSIECFEMEGDHMSMVKQPAVQVLADKLDAKLKRCPSCWTLPAEKAPASE